MSEFSTIFTGSLVESSLGDVHVGDFTYPGSIVHNDRVRGSQWDSFTLISAEPLQNEDPRISRPPYHYPIICRRSGPRMVAMSRAKAIVERFLSFYRQSDQAVFKRVSINVDSLVRELSKRPTQYSLGYVQARVPAFGASLRSASFYGEDLADASMFRDNLQLMTCFICGLKLVTGGYEIVRLSSDGGMSFRNPSAPKLREVESVLKFLREHGYLLSEIWPLG